MKTQRLIVSLAAALLLSECNDREAAPIDRFALVSRHNVVLTAPDTLGALTVGNGEFAFTVDVSGLQSFAADYENGISLGTQTQWGWHSMPGKSNYSLHDVAKQYFSCDSTSAPYAVQHNEGKAGDATRALRGNPHRLHLGMIGLVLLKKDGSEAKLGDLQDINQKLDLWRGQIESNYTVDGSPVKVILFAHQQRDAIAVRVESPLASEGRLMLKLDFPYGKDCHVCPGYDWENDAKHQSTYKELSPGSFSIERRLDSTLYLVNVGWNGRDVKQSQPHRFILIPTDSVLEFTAEFATKDRGTLLSFDAVDENSTKSWKSYWTRGGAIDFSRCTDPRAKELERRVILSQYLTKVQSAGSMPPQETGLTMNSWFGKFHLEMHWWHAAHFAMWDRADLLERSMPWYTAVTPKAKATAAWQGYEGARWQKMTDPPGNESPSSVGAFIIWQQPHPIYFAELLYRDNPSDSVLNKYRELVFNTADFMASFVKLRDGKYHLCHPLIPAQEIFKATETDDPAYELQYWYYGLSVAQQWRERLGMKPNEKWEAILADLAPLSIAQDLYLPNATTPAAYTDDQFRRDHPSVLGALGFLPANERVDAATMKNTLKNIMNKWQWETTWGWDYPLIAMTAARVGEPDMAIDALLLDVQKNTYLVNGHNYQDKRLRLYLPGNGGILAAVAMMAAGWDGSNDKNPGFPKDGKWDVRWEGLKKMP